MRLGSQVCFPEPGKITVEGRTLWGRSFQRPSGEVSQGQPGPEAEGQLQTPGQLQWRVSAAGGLGTRAALLGLNPVPRRPWPWAKALLSGPTGGKHTPGWRFKMLMRHATDEQAGAGTAHVHPEDPLPPNMFPSNASAHPRPGAAGHPGIWKHGAARAWASETEAQSAAWRLGPVENLEGRLPSRSTSS
ncbi:PREDICTED: uncharacterized protein LOC105581190 isoform X4 [Cercocebus atys]|uniref:uncharacterized protein LOC105581190 isoform X4 n=1 Tax=Cercocebus atys TaxID=9531 RepID=UPI0005F4CC07|nr:PREDICTED: uncharacterized protein LOC105581190 isoform X4 [Cercocebus atys]